VSGPPPLPVGLPPAREWRRVAGGDICESWEATLADGYRVFVKRTPYPPDIEAEGLEALRTAGAPVPKVVGLGLDTLVLEWVGGEPDWEGLGGALARVHRDVGPSFGWWRDNMIGRLEQPNGWDDDWGRFYAERRVRPHLDAPALPAELRRRLEVALDGPLQQLLNEHDPEPSLVHGDLWSGNVVDGRWLVDPAVAHADREYELAFMDVFGGFPPALLAAYEDVWPLPDGWRERRPALQLSHLLVHVRLFGGGYAGAVAGRLDALHW
jgi:fructosamine-3-kinase